MLLLLLLLLLPLLLLLLLLLPLKQHQQHVSNFHFLSFQEGIAEDEDDGISRFKESGLIIRPNFNDSSKTFSTAKLLPAEDFSPKDEKKFWSTSQLNNEAQSDLGGATGPG